MATARLVKSGTSSFKREQQKKVATRTALSKARIEARQIRKGGGSARAVVDKLGNVQLIQVEQPTLFTKEGKEAQEKDGFITGFSRADLTRIKSLEDREAKRQKELRNLSRDISTKKIVMGLPSARIVDVATTPSRSEFVRDITTQSIVTTLPSGRIVAEASRGRIPSKKALTDKEIIENVKPIDIKFPKLQTKLNTLNVRVSEAIGSRKLASKLEQFNINRFKDFTGSQFVGETPKRGQIPFTEKVSEKIITDILRNPISNSALILSGAGFTAGASRVGLSIAKLASGGTKAVKLAKFLGVSGKVAGGLLGTAYIGSVGARGIKEFKSKGTLTDTTSDAIRELILFKLGSNIGSSVKIQKLTKLRTDLNALPKDSRVKLDKQFKKIEKVASKEFKVKELGLVTKLDSQILTKSVSNAIKGRKQGIRAKGDIVTRVENKIFFSKRIPSKTKKFEVTQVFLKNDKLGLVEGNVYGKAVYNAKFVNGVVQPVGKPKNLDITISKSDFLELVKRFGKGDVDVVTRSVGVKGFTKTGKKGDLQLLVDKKGRSILFNQFTKDVSVKPSVRKIKDILSVKRDKIDVFEPSFSEVGKSFSFVQFTINPKTKKLTFKKPVGEFVKKAPKLTQFVYANADASVGFSIKLGKVESVTKSVFKKPVTGVSVVKVGNQNLKVIPIPPTKKVVVEKPRRISVGISKVRPVSRLVLLPKTIIDTVVKPQTFFKPKISVSSGQKGASKGKQVIKPITKVSVAQKQKQDVIQKPKIKITTTQKTLRKLKNPRFKIQKPIIPIPIKIKFPKSKVKKKSLKTLPQSQFKTLYTPTLAGQGKRRKKEDELRFFTGAEIRL